MMRLANIFMRNPFSGSPPAAEYGKPKKGI
jgi:hypothetical protein